MCRIIKRGINLMGKKITNEELDRRIIFESVKTGYKKGWLDGMNFEKASQGIDEEITEEEFNEMLLSQVVEKDAENVFNRLEKEFRKYR